jgi:hypothetical protein
MISLKDRTRNTGRRASTRLNSEWFRSPSTAHLEPRSLAAPAFQLVDVPQNWGISGIEQGLGINNQFTDNTDGKMQVTLQLSVYVPDFFQNGTGFTLTEQSSGTNYIDTAGSTSSSPTITIGDTQLSSAASYNPIWGVPYSRAVMVTQTYFGTGQNAAGANPVMWNIVDSTSGAPYTTPVTLSGSLTVSWTASSTARAGTGGCFFNFASAATGVAAVTNGAGDLTITFPTNGYIDVETFSGFFNNNTASSMTAVYSVVDATPTAGEAIAYNSRSYAAVGIGRPTQADLANITAQSELQWSFSENVSA